ncbi:hypothetical protein F5B19DRAFT_477472 [Rostrohypoxylon terebratum]|nr:hypothetical protein F5B19DRAFT_477472 [Rostrohypoxylon terebratum]
MLGSGVFCCCRCCCFCFCFCFVVAAAARQLKLYPHGSRPIIFHSVLPAPTMYPAVSVFCFSVSLFLSSSLFMQHESFPIPSRLNSAPICSYVLSLIRSIHPSV